MAPIDLVVAGSVAVNRIGQRIGKGGGYSDLEWALGLEFGYVTAKTAVATTVHPVQLLPDRLPVRPHDLALNLIATPEEVISVRPSPPKPQGLDWKLVTKGMLEEIPILGEVWSWTNR